MAEGGARAGTGTAYLVRAGAPLEGHLPHVLSVIFRDAARPDQGGHQVIFNGLELRGPHIPLGKRERSVARSFPTSEDLHGGCGETL